MGYTIRIYTDSLAQDCGISIGNALELPQSCAKPSMKYMGTMNHNNTACLIRTEVEMFVTEIFVTGWTLWELQ